MQLERQVRHDHIERARTTSRVRRVHDVLELAHRLARGTRLRFVDRIHRAWLGFGGAAAACFLVTREVDSSPQFEEAGGARGGACAGAQFKLFHSDSLRR